MRKPWIFWIALACLASVPAPATEVDNYTGRDGLTQDALPVLDAEVNRILDRAILGSNRDARQSGDGCSRMKLRQEVVRWIGPDPIGIFELWATFTDRIQHAPAGYAESIYRGATVWESPAMRLAGIGRTFKLAGHVVGTDKLGHFFLQGLGYYSRVHDDRADLARVLGQEHGEDGIWGMPMTGVKSYGDMSANYSGYRFWSEFFDGPRPYVRCKARGREWERLRDFSWALYVNDAWDEAINCSEFAASLGKTVLGHLSELGVSCPVDLEKCAAISRLEHAELFVSPACRAAGAAASRDVSRSVAAQPRK
jgi:hypothetical protein